MLHGLPQELQSLIKGCHAQDTYTGPPRLLVFGGNGFVGTRVCQQALETGLSVVSISRGGRPPLQADWVPRVDWVQASPASQASSGQLEGPTTLQCRQTCSTRHRGGSI